MATRFRKHRTRKVKGRKGLKTRKHRGGSILGNVKSKMTAVFNPSATATKKNNGVKTYYTANAVGAEPESRQQFINRRKAMKKGGDMASFLSKGKSLLNKITPQSTKNAQTFSKYLETVTDEIMHKLSHEDRVRMKNALMKQLKQDKEILNEKRSVFGESKFSNILEKINKVQGFLEKDTNNSNN
jgi:hypothetical protein